MKNYITMVKSPDEIMHRYKIIIWKDSGFHTASFRNTQQLEQYASTLGFAFRLESEQESERFGWIKRYSMSHEIDCGIGRGFLRLSELPKNARKIKALCNGSIVDCYFTNDGETITFHRPNPNATVENKNRYKSLEEYEKAVAERVYYPNSLDIDAVYLPLSLKEHLEHINKYGTY